MMRLDLLRLLSLIFILLIFEIVDLKGQNTRLRLSTAVDPAIPTPLDIYIGDRGAVQIYRDGNGQLYNPASTPNSTNMYNGVFILDGSYLVATNSNELDGYNKVWHKRGDVTNVSGAGTEASPWEITAELETKGSGDNYFADVTYSYVNGDDFFDVSLVVTIPAGNTDVIKVFHIMDTYLGGSDNGPAYTKGTAPYSVVGVNRADIFEAFIVGNLQWDRYSSHHYHTVLNEPYDDGELSNTLDVNPLTDNAMAVQWTLGVVSGVQPPITYSIGFSDKEILAPCTNIIINKHIGIRVNN